MFNLEGDWSDEEDAQTLSKSVFTKTTNTSSDVKQSKTVGKKSLMRTLQTLGSVPEWKNDDRQQDSDSEAEVASAPSKKKKRRKKKSHTKKSDEQQENGDSSQPVEEKPVAKKSKKDQNCSAEVKTTPALETKGKGQIKSVKAPDAKEAEKSERLSRKQWKNKMKNKKKCTNKFRTNTPEVNTNKPESIEVDGLKEEVGKLCSVNNNNNINGQKTIKETKSNLQKRKKPADATEADCEPEIQSQSEEKKVIEEDNKSPVDQKNVPVKRLKPDFSKEQTLKRQKLGKLLQNKETGQKTTQEEEKKGKPMVPDQQNVPVGRLKPDLSREQTLKREKLRKMLQSQGQGQKPREEEEKKDEPAVPEATEVKLDRSASLRSRMEQRLDAARFRYINEVLYSTTSGEARRMFFQDPEAFWIYHRGYTSQVQRWPSNPVDSIITYIQQRSSSLVVADFGCGDCKIARSVKNKVHSFDLAATCELVTVCDMANVPLGDDSVDIAVFCLSLMGTNLAEFLSEANRVLKMRGILKIAEVASRFDNVRNFMSALAKLGFKLLSKDTENTHFYAFEFEKTADVSGNVKKVGLQLKPCLYKKR